MVGWCQKGDCTWGRWQWENGFRLHSTVIMGYCDRPTSIAGGNSACQLIFGLLRCLYDSDELGVITGRNQIETTKITLWLHFSHKWRKRYSFNAEVKRELLHRLQLLPQLILYISLLVLAQFATCLPYNEIFPLTHLACAPSLLNWTEWSS